MDGQKCQKDGQVVVTTAEVNHTSHWLIKKIIHLHLQMNNFIYEMCVIDSICIHLLILCASVNLSASFFYPRNIVVNYQFCILNKYGTRLDEV